MDSLQYFNVDENQWEYLPFENSISGATINLPLKPGGGKLLKFKGETIVGLSNSTQTPTQFELKQNYPNPFNPSTTIAYNLLQNSSVSLEVNNVLGQRVDLLVNAEQEAGNHQVVWDASKFSSGLYFYRLKTEEFLQTKKMILLR